MARQSIGYDVDVGYKGEQDVRRAIGDLNKFETELDQVDQAAREISTSTGGMFDQAQSSFVEFASALSLVQQGFGAAQQAAQAAWDTISAGADISRTTQQAEALAQSIGENWSDLLSDMTDATAGMVSQADLAASAVDIIGLGMADTGEDVTRLSRLVGELGWDMQTLTLTLANQSTARLDSLGLSMTDVTDKVARFKEQGIAADEAFKFAVLEAGEEKLKLLGSTAGTTAGDIQLLETAWTDLTDAFAVATAGFAAPSVSGLAEFVVVWQGLQSAIDDGTISQKEFNQELLKLGSFADSGEAQKELFTFAAAVEATREKSAKATEAEAKAQDELNTAWREGNAALIESAASADKLFVTSKERGTTEAQIARELETQSRIAHDLLRDYKEKAEVGRSEREVQADIAAGIVASYNAQGEAVKRTAEELAKATAEAEAWSEAVQAASGDVFTTAAFDFEPPSFGDVQTDDFNQSIYDAADAAGAGAAALADLGLALGLITEDQAEYGIAAAQNDAITRSLAQAAKDGAISWSEYETAVEAAGRKLEETARVAEPWTAADFSNVPSGASAFFNEGNINQDQTLDIDTTPYTTAIQNAVDDATEIIATISDPDDPNIVTVDMEYQSVIDGQGEINDIKADLEKPVIVSVQFISSGKQDIIDAIEEFGGS